MPINSRPSNLSSKEVKLGGNLFKVCTSGAASSQVHHSQLPPRHNTGAISLQPAAASLQHLQHCHGSCVPTTVNIQWKAKVVICGGGDHGQTSHQCCQCSGGLQPYSPLVPGSRETYNEAGCVITSPPSTLHCGHCE